MASYPPSQPPSPNAPYGGDPRFQRQAQREQVRMQREAMRMQRDAFRMRARSLRRGSIVGPLLVIAVGVVFLLVQTGRLPAIRLWGWYGRWWPLLLIAIGLVRLAEWVFDRVQEQNLPDSAPRPRRTLGGGVVFLLIVLAAGGLVLRAMHNHANGFLGNGFNLNEDNLDEFLGDKHESDQTLTQQCGPNCVVSVDNPRGDISVTGMSDDGLVHLVAHKEVFTRSDVEAEAKARQFTPHLDASGNAISVSMPSTEGARADLRLTVPATSHLTISSNRGDVRVSSLHGPVAVTANHGDVALSAISGTMSAHINHGDSSISAHHVAGALTIEGHARDLTLSDVNGPVSMSGEFFGTTHLEHLEGMVRFHTSRTDLQLGRLDGELEISPNADLSGDEIAGPMSLNTRNRNITLERLSGDVSVTNRNGSIDLTAAPPLGNVTLENRNGTVTMTLPDETGFVLQADTTNGDIENDFGLQKSGTENHPSLSGTVGKGGPLVRIGTTQGDITLRKGHIAPLSPSTPSVPQPPAAPMAPDAFDSGLRERKAAEREVAEQLRAAEEQVRSANREAADAQKEAQRKMSDAQKELSKALQRAQQSSKSPDR